MVARMALGLAALASSVVAPVHAAASIDPVDTLSDAQISSAMVLYLNGPGVDLNSGASALIPLTSSAGLNQTASQRENIWFKGDLVLANTNNYNEIRGNASIAYLSCDSNANDSVIVTPSTMFQTLMENSPGAIILYSLQGNGCEVKSDELSYWAIYTMNDPQASGVTFNMTQAAHGNIEATISGRSNVTGDVSPGPQPGDQTGNSSAVAMSILYSITGLITVLFLVIIATGAVRAHRYPDRYGPRAGYAGRPRQSRAKGLARAVLETLPIVKFGDTTHPPKKDPEHELESIAEERTSTAAQPQATTPSPEPTQHGTATPNEDGTGSQASSEAPGPAAAPASSNTEGDENLGCSICTEDFTIGEDVRVLPCNHKYHPQCIDPWLIDVSGTCPLCRHDLRPADTDGETASQSPAGLAPPLENDGNESDGASQPSTQRSRMSRFFDIHRLRHASAEERIEALRRYRTEHGDSQDPSAPSGPSREASVNEETSRRAKLTDRLRDKFRIRTTRRGRDGPLEQESSGAGPSEGGS